MCLLHPPLFVPGSRTGLTPPPARLSSSCPRPSSASPLSRPFPPLFLSLSQVFVSNHTSMIDYVVLSNMTPLVVIMQRQGGWVGFLQVS